MFSGLPCAAQDTETPAKPIEGPATIDLKGVANLKIPLGYTFLDSEQATAKLQAQNEMVPNGLIGIMVSKGSSSTDSSSQWAVVLSFLDSGYVKDAMKGDVNETALLNKLGEKKGIKKISWVTHPKVNPDLGILEWTVAAEFDKRNVRNYVAWLFGKDGIIKVTTVFDGATDLDSLRLLVGGISFKPGKSYADFKEGDKTSTADLAQLLIQEDRAPASASASLTAKPRDVLNIALVVVVAALGIGALVVGVGKLKRAFAKLQAEPAGAQFGQSQLAAAALAVSSEASGTGVAKQNGASLAGAAPDRNGLRPRLVPSPLPPEPKNGRFSRTLNGNRKNQKREFDYNRYFADLMSTVSSHGLTLELPPAAPELQPGMETPATPETNGNGQNRPNAVQVNADLIARQTALIEEQRRVIEEQTRLIEEKSRIIAEKNHILHLQRELFATH